MDRDGTKKGYDTELLNKITKKLEIPVIASGGVGNIDHIIDGIKEGGQRCFGGFHFSFLKLL